MLFPRRHWAGLADGSITLAFRRWTGPTVRGGGTLRSPVGTLAIDDVRVVDVDDVDDDDARRAGFADRAELLAELRPPEPGRLLYRVALHHVGPDERPALAARADLGPDEVAELRERLARFDRSRRAGPWTLATLRLVATHPGVRAADLAASLGRDTAPFKRDVRALKALGLTISLEVGYRLAPRGEALLAALGELPDPS